MKTLSATFENGHLKLDLDLSGSKIEGLSGLAIYEPDEELVSTEDGECSYPMPHVRLHLDIF